MSTTETMGNGRVVRADHRGDALAHRALWAVTFAVFLPTAALRRAVPGARRRRAVERRSIVQEARVAASTVSAIAFMG